MTPADVTVAIPTYERGEVLVATVEALLREAVPPIFVIDQTPHHRPEVQTKLEELARDGQVRWLRRPHPSIPAAMNVALKQADRPLVLFLDDDIIPGTGLVGGHAASYEEGTWAVVGQVLQPGQAADAGPHHFATDGLRAFLDFPFNSTHRSWVANVMAGNLSVRRERALGVGGFDENFVGSAFRFETEFCRRLIRAGGRVLFQPSASVQHLRIPTGGTRSLGPHQTSTSPVHGVGDYYFALRQGLGVSTLSYVLRRPIREVCTRFHLRRPWWIPAKLLGEARALAWAWRLRARGPRLVSPEPPAPERAA